MEIITANIIAIKILPSNMFANAFFLMQIEIFVPVCGFFPPIVLK